MQDDTSPHEVIVNGRKYEVRIAKATLRDRSTSSKTIFARADPSLVGRTSTITSSSGATASTVNATFEPKQNHYSDMLRTVIVAVGKT